MQKIRVPINSFQYGEISESVIHRLDSQIYQASAQRLENVLVRAEGGVKKRPGLRNIYDFGITRDTSKTLQCDLVPFVFSDDERYIIAIEHQKVRCFRIVNGTITLVSTITQDTNGDALPFDDDYIHEYTHAQSGDVLFVAHPLFMPRMIVRTGLTSFEITPFTFDQTADASQIHQPYSVFHATNVTLDPSANTGTGVTLTVSEDYFDTTGSIDGSGNYPDSLHVGVYLRYDQNEIEITSVQSATQATGDIVGTLRTRLTVANPLRTNDGSTTIEVTHINHGFSGTESIIIEDATSVGGINAASINGARTITSVIDDNTYTFTAGASANTSEDGGGFVKIVSHAPTSFWTEQSFSAKRGYPAAVEFHENRLCFGGTIAEPDALWMSRIGRFFNFDVGEAADDDSINITAATGDVNEIRYLVSNRDLQVFTASAELYVPTFLNQTITPTNAQIRKQTPYGSEFIEPMSIDGATVFIQTGGKVAREYLYTDDENAYTATAVSTIASHLLGDLKDIAVVNGFAELSESYAIFPKADGTCAVFGSNRAERRAGWVRFTTQGSFDSIVAIDDRLFATVWFDNTDLRLVEFDTDYQLDNADLYTLTSNVADVSADFDNGTVVHVIAIEGNRQDYLGTHTVASGNIDLSVYNPTYTQAYIGYSFDVQLITNPIDASARSGPVTGQPRGISSAILDIRDTRSLKVNTSALITESAFNGKKEFRILGYSRDPQITITQNEPLSLQVNGLIAELIL
jgi:hypothetical protein